MLHEDRVLLAEVKSRNFRDGKLWEERVKARQGRCKTTNDQHWLECFFDDGFHGVGHFLNGRRRRISRTNLQTPGSTVAPPAQQSHATVDVLSEVEEILAPLFLA